MESKKVCVIGAGPSGLVAARELRKEGHSTVILEQNNDIGGQWLYEPNVDSEEPLGINKVLNVHSSIYESLRTASPREIIGFTDFPFLAKKDRDVRRYPGHKEVWLYLKDFCEWFGLREIIRFNTRVEHVGMLDYDHEFGKDLKWVVKSKEMNTEKIVEEEFDAVVVASGHYAHPRLPSIEGMDVWKRKQLHTHVYRVAEPFRDEVVVIVGSSQSGMDISMELVGLAKEVYISARSAITEGFSKFISKHPNLHLRPQVESLHEDGRVQFVDGFSVVVDTIIYCTGYSYTFPFLDSKGIVEVDDNRVGPLFEHTFPPALAPSLSFIGIPTKVIGFPFLESQARWIAKVLSGKRRLPSYADMMHFIKEFYHSKELAGIPKWYTHDIGDFEYCDKYADYSGFPHMEEWKKQLTLLIIKNYYANWETYKDLWTDEEERLIQQLLLTPQFTRPTLPPPDQQQHP